ncbi:MAG TPA: RNA 3'-terminal phosphate cyclase [Phycisphaerales bacterium]|nr:RNA 3'-terminal phosphate cyclase [Phycisphaerales bacterium]
MIKIDGSMGEGGGQVLRTSLALSMVTGQPFVMSSIRAGRKKPGLLRQHLTAVKAAAEVSCAHVSGVSLGSDAIEFTPGPVNAGSYHFSIGSAGSTTLVLQTVLPALIRANGPSEVVIEGGTHNPFAPTAHFLTTCFLPVLAKMGPKVDVELVRHGFFPAGGGQIRVTIEPVERLEPISLIERGEITDRRAIAIVAGLPGAIADRELETVAKKLKWTQEDLRHELLGDGLGPGNVLSIELGSEQLTEVITGFGEKGVSSEQVARRAAKRANEYISSGVPVGMHLADQLLIPLALAGEGTFLTGQLTRHTKTNISVIEKFMSCAFDVQDAAPGRHLISLRA